MSTHPLRDPEIRKKYYANWIKQADRREARMKIKLNNYFTKQKNRVIERLSGYRSFTKSLVDEVFDMKLEVELSNTLLLGLMKQYLQESGQEAVEFVGYDRPFILTSDLQATLEKRSVFLARNMNETTFDTLKREFTQSIEANEGRDQLVKRIQGVYGGISKGRARTIARTETLVASQEGKFAGYEQAGLDIKIWVAVMDSATRDSHASIDGEERPIRQPFSNGLMMPGDGSGPPEETINCRCSI